MQPEENNLYRQGFIGAAADRPEADTKQNPSGFAPLSHLPYEGEARFCGELQGYAFELHRSEADMPERICHGARKRRFQRMMRWIRTGRSTGVSEKRSAFR